MFNSPTLHLVCGKIAAGKSTLCRQLAAAPATVLLAEDDWLSGLYPGEINSLDDYVRCSRRLRALVGPHVTELLRAGLGVVLDFPANTLASRRWMRSIIEESGAGHRLHLIELDDASCKARLRRRNAAGGHAYQASDAEFDLFTRYYVPPGVEEGFEIIMHPG
ncbi:AAA family ATPase [Maricaulis salignorans]|uniref:Predicted kinase n=1 Tax=Maricaulis salignorans TaxID=144026 RepID=A0A1G9TMD4_9PROT|nr:ATP-binding protein [Maricaulis salignorans]SDM48812.1 Predicted kinase [Maricaulis salignorans]